VTRLQQKHKKNTKTQKQTEKNKTTKNISQTNKLKKTQKITKNPHNQLQKHNTSTTSTQTQSSTHKSTKTIKRKNNQQRTKQKNKYNHKSRRQKHVHSRRKTTQHQNHKKKHKKQKYEHPHNKKRHQNQNKKNTQKTTPPPQKKTVKKHQNTKQSAKNAQQIHKKTQKHHTKKTNLSASPTTCGRGIGAEFCEKTQYCSGKRNSAPRAMAGKPAVVLENKVLRFSAAAHFPSCSQAHASRIFEKKTRSRNRRLAGVHNVRQGIALQSWRLAHCLTDQLQHARGTPWNRPAALARFTRDSKSTKITKILKNKKSTKKKTTWAEGLRCIFWGACVFQQNGTVLRVCFFFCYVPLSHIFQPRAARQGLKIPPRPPPPYPGRNGAHEMRTAIFGGGLLRVFVDIFEIFVCF